MDDYNKNTIVLAVVIMKRIQKYIYIYIRSIYTRAIYYFLDVIITFNFVNFVIIQLREYYLDKIIQISH